MHKKTALMCSARDCMQEYAVHVVQGMDHPKYCSVRCQRREAKHRKRDLTAPAPIERPKPKAPVKKYSKPNTGSDIELVGLCPHPFKVVYRTQEEAESMIDMLEDEDMEVYRCKCGALHIGHPSPGQLARRARLEYKHWVNSLSE